MRYLQNSKGYTLIIAIVAVVIFSVLGLSLITLTSNGMAKNETRLATVQAKDLSDKGVDFAVNSIQNILLDSLTDSNNNFVMTKSEFEKLLNSTLSKAELQCPTPLPEMTMDTKFGIEIAGTIDGAKTLVCIDKVENLEVDPNNPEKNKYKRNVTFKSYGFSREKYDVTTATILIGTDAIPDQLKYAVSSNDGEVYIYGGGEVTGDLKSSGNFHIFEQAFHSWPTDPEWASSVPLKVNPTIGNASGKFILSNPSSKIYYYDKNTNKESYTNYKTTNTSDGKEKIGKIKLKNHSKSIGIDNQNSNLNMDINRKYKLIVS